MLFLSVIDALDFLEKIQLYSLLVTHSNKSIHIFGETGATIAHTGIEEVSANALVQTHAMCDLFNISACLLAYAADHVDKGDFHGEK